MISKKDAFIYLFENGKLLIFRFLRFRLFKLLFGFPAKTIAFFIENSNNEQSNSYQPKEVTKVIFKADQHH